MRRDCQYWTDGKRYIRVWCNKKYQPENEQWEDAKKEVLHHTDGWVPSATAHLSILYEDGWHRCTNVEQPPPDWWNRTRTQEQKDRKQEMERQRRAKLRA